MPRSHSFNAFEAATVNLINDSQTSIELTSVEGLVAPGKLVMAPTTPTEREWISFTGIAGNTLTGVTRGLPGSSGALTAAVEHGSGTVVRATVMHQHIDDIWDAIEDLDVDIDTHTDAPNPHPGYATDADVASLAATVSAQGVGITELEEDVLTAQTGILDLGAADLTHFDSTDGHPLVTDSFAGFMSVSQRNKLDRIGRGIRLNTSTNQDLGTDTTFIAFDIETFDPDNWHTPNTPLIVVPYTGWYMARLECNSFVDRAMVLRYNSTTPAVGSGDPMAAGADIGDPGRQSRRVHVSGPIRVGAGTEVRLEAAGTTDETMETGSQFWMTFIGP